MSVRILVGDVRSRLAELPDGSVQCVVTSPPYYGLRDYGTASWDGGDPECDHKAPSRFDYKLNPGLGPTGVQDQASNAGSNGSAQYRQQCGKCGAVRIDNQIGLEPTLAEYIATLVDVFREVRRVLRDDGTCWLNMGDSYASGSPGSWGSSDKSTLATGSKNGAWAPGKTVGTTPARSLSGLKPKDLMMVPARVALALQDDGWWLRSDIIWHKPNPMPESCRDRPTSAHEHIFLLTKSARYFYDAEAVREENAREWDPANNGAFTHQTGEFDGKILGRDSMPHSGLVSAFPNPAGRNQRNVWTIATHPYAEAHFATFPPEIPRRCIKAGTSEKGQCAACGAPWTRVVVDGARRDLPAFRNGSGYVNQSGPQHNSTGNEPVSGAAYEKVTTGCQPGCACDADVVPQTVLDPFLGAGTTLLVADQIGRNGIGVELSPTYASMAEQRIRGDAPMFAQVSAD